MDHPPQMSSSPPSFAEPPKPFPSSSNTSYEPVGVFWDYENCPPSANASGYNLVDNIRALASQFGAVSLFKAYLQFPDKSSPKQTSLRSELQSCGLSLTDCPHNNGKNSVDLMMIVDIMAFVKDNSPPATILLISGDRDFAYLLSTVRWRKYRVVLISHSSMTHESLTAQASVVYDWQSDVLKARPPSKPPLRRALHDASSSVGFPTTPQWPDGSSASDVHVVGLSEEHLAAAAQPFALSPRSVSIVTVNTVRPAHATLPQDIPPVESDATPVPTRAEIPAEAASDNVPMTPTSDDWIVADLTSESAMDQSSPKTIDPVDEDGPQSPPFSSPEMIPSEGEGDIPSSPGYLLLIGEESSIDSSVQDLRDINPSGTMKPLSRACGCKICARSPVLPESQNPAQEIMRGHKVEPVPRESSIPLPTAPLPPVSLPAEAVQLSYLPPAHEVPLNTLAPTFTPRTPRPSWAEITARTDAKHDFKDLIAVLGELSASSNQRPRFSAVSPLLKGRKPDIFEMVGVTQFKTYLQLAESAGIVSVEQGQDGDGWVTLRHQRNIGLDRSPQHALPQQTESRFRDLIKILNDLRLAEDPEPRFSTVCPRLLKKNPSVYEDAGVTKFKEYVEAAAEAGVVTVRGVRNGDGWLKLCLAYRNPPVHSSTSASTVSTPPTRAVSTPFPFTPLVDFLKSKQLTSAQPIPFSDILAHLISTLGYPDLLSLYNSVPGVTTFGQYLDAAIASGVVSLVSGTTLSRDALVSLRDVKFGVGPRLPVPVNPASPRRGPFEPLISNLTRLWHEGKQEPMLSEIHPLILAQDIMAYGRVGATTIKDYVIKAAIANLVVYDPLVMPGGTFMASTVRLCEPPSQSPEDPPPPAHSDVSATLLPSFPPSQEIAASQPPANLTPNSFRDIVAVLKKLRASTGEMESRFSSVVPLLLKRKPHIYTSVGVTKFKDYVILAMENGVVRVRGMKQGDGWVSLCDPRPGGPKSDSTVSPQSSKSSEDGMVTARSSFVSLKGAGVDSKFVDLVEMLGEMWKNGEKRPLFSHIAPQLLKDERKKARTLTACGVDKFKAYAELAKEAGIVKIYYERLGEERLLLDPTIRVRAGYI